MDPRRSPDFFRIFPNFHKIMVYLATLFKGPKKGCRGSLRDPRRSPDFLRIFPNFHIFRHLGGRGHQILWQEITITFLALEG